MVHLPKSIVEALGKVAKKHLKRFTLESKMILRAHHRRQANDAVVRRADRPSVHREPYLKLPPTELVSSRLRRNRSVVKAPPMTTAATKLAPNLEFS